MQRKIKIRPSLGAADWGMTERESLPSYHWLAKTVQMTKLRISNFWALLPKRPAPLSGTKRMEGDLPWYTKFPAPRSKPRSMTDEQVAQFVKDPEKLVGRDYIIVDVRRTDFEVRSRHLLILTCGES